MSDEILTRIKTAIETTEILNAIEFFNADELNRYAEVAYKLYMSNDNLNIEVYNGDDIIPHEQLMVSAILHTALFTHFVNIGQTNNDGAMWNFQLFLGETILTYINILEYEERPSNWWEDAVEYGLTSYQQATNLYNSSQ